MKNSFMLAALIAASLYSGASFAGPTTSTYYDVNTTAVVGSDGSITAPGGSIGADYQTLSMTATQTGSSVVLNFITHFSGVDDSIPGVQVGYADLIFGGLGDGYGVSLGYENGSIAGTPNNGGLAAGVYGSITTKTSQQVFSGVPGVTYGVGYSENPGGRTQSAPTVITGGKWYANASVNSVLLPDGLYDVSISMADIPINMVADFENGSLWAFWGTGDCANGAFLVPEPVSMAAFGVGLIALGAMAQRRNPMRQRASKING